jgi:hypothetical protein
MRGRCQVGLCSDTTTRAGTTSQLALGRDNYTPGEFFSQLGGGGHDEYPSYGIYSVPWRVANEPANLVCFWGDPTGAARDLVGNRPYPYGTGPHPALRGRREIWSAIVHTRTVLAPTQPYGGCHQRTTSHLCIFCGHRWYAWCSRMNQLSLHVALVSRLAYDSHQRAYCYTCRFA